MRIALAADHGGFELKEKVKKYLENKNHIVCDYGTFSSDSVDYPDFARKVAMAVSTNECERGILICRNGIGMSIAANRFKGVRAATCYDKKTAESSRFHDNTNVLSLGSDFTKEKDALDIIDTWLTSQFDLTDRRLRREKKLDGVQMRVAVSFLSKNEDEMKLENILKIIPRLESAGVDTIQWDLMDGKYNPNDTIRWFDANYMKSVMENTSLDSEAHLMVSEPWRFVDSISDYCSTIIFHFEACPTHHDVVKTIDKIKSLEKRVGIAIEPQTPVEKLDKYLPLIDLVLIMTVKTGYAGQKFIDMSDKIRYLVGIRREEKLNFEIEVDGGINGETIETVRSAGVEAVNSASYILNNDYEKAVKTLKGI